MEVSPWDRFLAWGLSSYAMLVRSTSRYQVEGLHHVSPYENSDRPFIIASWHGMTMMFSGYITRPNNPREFVMIVPDDSRGAVLSTSAERLGFHSFIISMEADSMVAARRLLELIRELKQGKCLGINPDGPDGPSHEPKEGVIFIARKAQAPIIPVGVYTATGYRLRRWDQYMVPFPLSRIVIVHGEPLLVSADDDLEEARLELRERLNKAEREAEALYHQGKRPS